MLGQGVAFALLTFVCSASAAADTEHLSRTFKVTPDGLLWLNGFSGRVTITGTDNADVSVDAIRRIAPC